MNYSSNYQLQNGSKEANNKQMETFIQKLHYKQHTTGVARGCAGGSERTS